MNARSVVILLCVCTLVRAFGVTPRDIAGEYVRGEGQQFGIRLTLLPDGRWTTVSGGCMPGDFHLHGLWRLHGSQLSLREDGQKEGVWRLHILPRDSSFILVADGDLAKHKEQPSEEYYYFKRLRAATP